jgi:hypothetical protein
MSGSFDPQFRTLREESDYGFTLIMDIVQAAKSGNPYREEIVQMWDIAFRNPDVMILVRELLISLERNKT